jgi:hypothetical protein
MARASLTGAAKTAVKQATMASTKLRNVVINFMAMIRGPIEEVGPSD